VKNYRLTTISCFIGIFVQAVITNITPVIFIPMMEIYGFQYSHLGILVAINFITQLCADIIISCIVDKVGYRKLILPACVGAFAGIVLFSMSPFLFPENVFMAIAVTTVLISFCSGMFEVLLSPIIAGIPGTDKGAEMNLLHSFYAWGLMATVIVTTIALFLFGRGNWQFIVLFWALVPLVALVMFLKSPFPDIVPEEHRLKVSDLFFKPCFFVAMIAILVGAASEVTMSQWSSTFMERGLSLPKLQGDLIGMCGFAAMLGIGRLLYGLYGSKINISNVLIAGSALAVACYFFVSLSTVNALNIIACIVCGLATSLLWPGTLVIASEKYPLAGAWMFAILAAAGDIGASAGPWLTGFFVDFTMGSPFNINFSSFLNVTLEQGALRFGILVSAIFPVLAVIVHLILKRLSSDSSS